MKNILVFWQSDVEYIAAIAFDAYDLRSAPSYAVAPVAGLNTALQPFVWLMIAHVRRVCTYDDFQIFKLCTSTATIAILTNSIVVWPYPIAASMSTSVASRECNTMEYGTLINDLGECLQ